MATALDELDVERLDESQAAVVIAERLAGEVADGSRSVAAACAEGARLCRKTNYEHDALSRFVELDDELGSLDRRGRTFLGRTVDDIRHEVAAMHSSQP